MDSLVILATLLCLLAELWFLSEDFDCTFPKQCTLLNELFGVNLGYVLLFVIRWQYLFLLSRSA